MVAIGIVASSPAYAASGDAPPFASHPKGQAPCPEGWSRSGTYVSDLGDRTIPQARFARGWKRVSGTRIAGGTYLTSTVSGSSAWFHFTPWKAHPGRRTYVALAHRGWIQQGAGRVSVNDQLISVTSRSSAWRGLISNVTDATTTEGGEMYPWVEHRRTGSRATWSIDNLQVYTCREAKAVSRVAEADSYALSARLAGEWEPGVKTIVLASGESIGHSVTAGALAARERGPLLLTRRGSVPATVRAELQRLNPSRVIIVGSPSIVSDGVAEDVASIVPTVQRLSGSDRYDMAAKVSERFATGRRVYIASGQTYQDAMSGAALAGREKRPLLLTPTATLSPSAAAALRRLKPSSIVIVGGTGTVSSSVQRSLAAYGPVSRVGGSTPYATSAAVAKRFGKRVQRSYLVSVHRTSDAIPAGALAAKNDAPVLLTSPGSLPAPVDSYLRSVSDTRGVVLGPTSRVGSIVRDQYGRTMP